MNKSPRTQEEIAPYQAVSAVLTFLRLFIQESVAVCMNNQPGVFMLELVTLQIRVLVTDQHFIQ